MLSPEEHIEHFSDRLKLVVSPAHTFGTDALLLAAFSLPSRREKALDLGTGCGVVPFYWLLKGAKNVSGLEVQPAGAGQFRRSIALSGVENDCRAIEADLRDAPDLLGRESFDLVSMNPPYTKKGGGIESGGESERLARHETGVTLGEVCRAAGALLKFGGRFCVCLPPYRLTEAMLCMKEEKLEPKRLRFVSKTAAAAPWLFLLEGKKGRNPGLAVEPPFYLYTEDGRESEMLLALTEDYRRFAGKNDNGKDT